MSDTENMILYKLACGHLKLATSRNIPVTKCYECSRRREAVVLDVHVDEWATRCMTCKYARYSGISHTLASLLASRHERTNPQHVVVVSYGPNPVAVKAREKFIRQGLIRDPAW